MLLSVIVCVYNERDTVLPVIGRVQAAGLPEGWSKELIVVDNCSTDGTRELLQGLIDPNVKVIYQPRNLGKGTSVRTAIPLCQGAFTITQDADLEYDPQDYGRLLDKALAEELDVVYGSRVLGRKRYHYYTRNYWGVRALTLLTNVLFGCRFTDVATNYKLVRTPVLQSLDLTGSGFELDFELTDKLALATRRIGEAPISYSPRTYAQGKKIRAADGLRALWVIVRDRLVGHAPARRSQPKTSAG
jgi:dolichol-phosphate mannosyltransferase